MSANDKIRRQFRPHLMAPTKPKEMKLGDTLTRRNVEYERQSGYVVFGGGVVVGEGVVVVVVAFAGGAEDDEDVFRRIRLGVVRTSSPQMGNAVHRPRQVQAHRQSVVDGEAERGWWWWR